MQAVSSSQDIHPAYSQGSKEKKMGRDAFEGVLMDRIYAKMFLTRGAG